MKQFTLKYLFFIPTLITISLLNSCAVHNGTMTGNAAISDANFTVAGFASGTSQCIYVFGIGGLKKQGMVLEAKRNMYALYPLKPGQAFANVTVDFKRGVYILFNKTVCTITADVIDFNKQPDNKDFSFTNAEINASVPSKIENFLVGEQVFYEKNYSLPPIGATITAFNKGKAQIRFAKSNGNMDHNIVSLSKLYKITNDSSSAKIDPIYQVGDTVYFTSREDFNLSRGIIFAIGTKGACIIYEKNNEKLAEIIRREDFKSLRLTKMEKNKNDLQGNWTLINLNDSEVTQTAKTPLLKINAHDLNFTGFGGCNQFFGSFTVAEFGIRIGPIGATRKACLDNNIESDFFKALGSQSFRQKRIHSSLTLKSNENTLIFKLVED